jgi:zinc protease
VATELGAAARGAVAGPAASDAIDARGTLPVPRLPGRIAVERLANGLDIALVHNPQAPIVTTALLVRAGTRDEPAGQNGVAHFLEHMMFKGSPEYGLGEVDRRTQALGGANNAFTTHDLTAYTFDFAADRWHHALAFESDRMRALLLDEHEVESERQVILEEIAMYEDDPWDALEMAALALFFGDHPYGRPVLGTPRTLARIGRAELDAFHRRFHVPANAIAVVCGDLGAGALDAVARHFEGLPAPPAGAAGTGRPPLGPAAPPSGSLRLERRHGEVPRLLVVLPAPASSAPDFATHRLLVSLLGGGRASRLHRALVDEGQLCLSASVDLIETDFPGALTISCELLPGVAPARVEATLAAELQRLRAAPPSAAELERAKRIVLADWVFGHERTHQQAVAVGFALAHGDLELPERQLRAVAEASGADCVAAAQAGLELERGSVLAWSLPEDGA